MKVIFTICMNQRTVSKEPGQFMRNLSKPCYHTTNAFAQYIYFIFISFLRGKENRKKNLENVHGPKTTCEQASHLKIYE